MSKKGLLTLQIEIDYDQMVSEDKVEALTGFTGAKSADEIMQVHMNQLGEKLDSVVKDLPLMRYEITGKFVDMVDNVPAVESVEEGVVDEMPMIEEPVVSETKVDYIKLLNDDLFLVSTEKGFPQEILVNGEMNELLLKNSGLTLNDIVKKYNGFPIRVEAMEEMYSIKYKDYNKHEVFSYTRLPSISS